MKIAGMEQPKKLVEVTYRIERTSENYVTSTSVNRNTMYHVFERRMNIKKPTRWKDRCIASYDTLSYAEDMVRTLTAFQELSQTHMIVDNDWISNPLVEKLVKASTWVWNCYGGADPEEVHAAHQQLENVLNEIEIVTKIRQAQQ
jgi:hypothetical protein